MFLTMFYTICVVLVIGILVSIVTIVPLMILTIPYAFWVGVQKTKGKYPELQTEPFLRSVKNAFKLYKSWILRKTPTF